MKISRNYWYLLSLLPACAAIFGNLSGGWWTLSNIVFELVILTVLELVLGKNLSNKHSSAQDPFPKLILYAHVFAHSAVIFTLMYGIYTGVLTGPFLFIAAMGSAMEAGSGAIVVAHELIHKHHRISRLAGDLLLALSGNFYFKVHHLRIHHKNVGLQEDAATAKRGESLYAFYRRTVKGQIQQGWDSEKRRLNKLNKPAFSMRNEVLRSFLFQVALAILIFYFLGLMAFLAWLMVIVVASSLLEYVNYIEHYGLVRENGEKVNHTHSWNSDRVVSRFFLVDLSRHADHHYHASKPYHTLDSYPHSPSLPGGYASLVFPAMIPFWWFRIVHPRLDSYKNRV